MIRNNDFIKRAIGSGFAIVAIGSATKFFNGMISVNGTGSFIWDCLENEITMDELVAKITAEYDVDADRARTDAEAFVKDLKGVGAVAD